MTTPRSTPTSEPEASARPYTDSAAYQDTDDAEAVKVLAAVRHCADSWESGARLVGNVRAGDISRACTIAINALAQPASAPGCTAWQPIETIPQDRPIDGWHKVWKCPITIAYRSWGDRSAWVEKTLTTEWPIEAFTHWRETCEPPAISSTERAQP